MKKNLFLIFLLAIPCAIFARDMIQPERMQYHYGEVLPSRHVLPISKILENLKTRGYPIVKTIELVDDSYIATVINNAGKKNKIIVDGGTGQIKDPKQTRERLSAVDIAHKVEQAGYRHIIRIDTQWFREKYIVKAFNAKNKMIELEVDAKTGKISQQ